MGGPRPGPRHRRCQMRHKRSHSYPAQVYGLTIEPHHSADLRRGLVVHRHPRRYMPEELHHAELAHMPQEGTVVHERHGPHSLAASRRLSGSRTCPG
jgi:hypothetical protein